MTTNKRENYGILNLSGILYSKTHSMYCVIDFPNVTL